MMRSAPQWRGMALGLCIAGLPLAATAEAQPQIPRSERPGLGSLDARRMVDSTATPWRSLGRVQTGLGSRCTGTLVAPDQVLTAAHCLVAPSGRLVQPGSLHFLLGYAAGQWTAHRQVVAVRVGPDFDAARRGPPGADWALLKLDSPVGQVPALPLRSARPGERLLLGGYQQDRPEVLMADIDCAVLGTATNAGLLLLRHGCAGTRGSSGAPLLQEDAAGDWFVTGVAVAATRHQAGGVAVPAASIR
jgi:protease YdgD